MSTDKYDRAFEKVKDSDGEFTNEQLAKMVGFKPVTDVEKLVVPQVSAKVRSALENRLRKIEEFGERGGFRRKRGEGRNNGVHQILRGDDFVRDQIGDAVSAGASALIDAGQFEREARGSAYMAPQVLVNVDHSMSVMRDESFGPVLGIMKVTGDEQAIDLMNDSEFGLTASIWTRDIEAAEAIGTRVETETVFMNRCDYLDPALTWTGVKNTGRGGTLSKIGYENLTRPKSFHLRF